jgi:hypothetical protein
MKDADYRHFFGKLPLANFKWDKLNSEMLNVSFGAEPGIHRKLWICSDGCPLEVSSPLSEFSYTEKLAPRAIGPFSLLLK